MSLVSVKYTVLAIPEHPSLSSQGDPIKHCIAAVNILVISLSQASFRRSSAQILTSPGRCRLGALLRTLLRPAPDAASAIATFPVLVVK